MIPFSGEPTRSCPGVPDEQVYDENTNPTGVRCTLQDYMVNVFGRRDESVWETVEKELGRGFAGRPFDNVGVEYGREALMNGTITQAQFADLNVKIGGADIDATPAPDRIEADRPALERVYRSGAVNQATHLDKVAIIDLRGPDPGAFHDVYRTYAMRARLEREHGTAANQVLWRGQVPLFGDVNYVDEAIVAMDEWLAAVEKDPRDMPLGKKIIEDKPESLQDRCTNGAGTDLPAAECDTVVESYSSPRIQAGMPFADDTIKCELAPLRKSHYLPLQISDATFEPLQGAFPKGICDYAKPGVDRVPDGAVAVVQAGPGRRAAGRPAAGPSPRPAPDRPAARPVDRSLDVSVKAPRLASDSRRGRKIRLRIGGKRGLEAISHFVLQYRRTGRGTKQGLHDAPRAAREERHAGPVQEGQDRRDVPVPDHRGRHGRQAQRVPPLADGVPVRRPRQGPALLEGLAAGEEPARVARRVQPDRTARRDAELPNAERRAHLPGRADGPGRRQGRVRARHAAEGRLVPQQERCATGASSRCSTAARGSATASLSGCGTGRSRSTGSACDGGRRVRASACLGPLWYRLLRPMCPDRPATGTYGTDGTRADVSTRVVSRLGPERSLAGMPQRGASCCFARKATWGTPTLTSRSGSTPARSAVATANATASRRSSTGTRRRQWAPVPNRTTSPNSCSTRPYMKETPP